MLPRVNRLPSSKISHLKSHGNLLQSPFFGLLVCRTPRSFSGVGPRFGFIVSLKVSSKATQRNRLRRLLSEAVYQILPRVLPDHDFLFLAKHPMLNAHLRKITQTLTSLLQNNLLLTK